MNAVTIEVPTDLVLREQLEAFEKQVFDALKDPGLESVKLDLSNTRAIDSKGVGAIIKLYREVVFRKLFLLIVGANPNVYRVFTMTGLNKVINVEERV